MGGVTEQEMLSYLLTCGIWRKEGGRAEPVSTRSALLQLKSCHTFPGVRTPGTSGWHP